MRIKNVLQLTFFLCLYKETLSHIIFDSYLDYSDYKSWQTIFNWLFSFYFWAGFLFWSSRQEMFWRKGVLRYFTKFTRKHQCQSLFFNKKSTSGWLLIKRIKKKVQNDFRIFAESEWTTFSFVHIFLSSFFQYWLSSNEFASKTKFSRNSTAFPII